MELYSYDELLPYCQFIYRIPCAKLSFLFVVMPGFYGSEEKQTPSSIL
jgi:hypothetical protein